MANKWQPEKWFDLFMHLSTIAFFVYCPSEVYLQVSTGMERLNDPVALARLGVMLVLFLLLVAITWLSANLTEAILYLICTAMSAMYVPASEY